MTLEEALEIAQEDRTCQETGEPSDYQDAIDILIEAGKVIKAIRPYSNTNKSYYLPGETKE